MKWDAGDLELMSPGRDGVPSRCKHGNAVTDLDQSGCAYAQTMTGMAPQRLCRSHPGDPVEIAARRADSMPLEQRFSDANLLATQFGPDQPGHDQITSMLTGAEWQTLPALRARQILGMDQGHLATIGQPPKPTPHGIAILGKPSINDR